MFSSSLIITDIYHLVECIRHSYGGVYISMMKAFYRGGYFWRLLLPQESSTKKNKKINHSCNKIYSENVTTRKTSELWKGCFPW